ncbi:hypothetical protein HUA74_02095 [Myxococcus sp. CA051A]|uniref:Uncharacterized protein n=1 Tax=Myxococcus llanfairpwllgwyngyllgogerychwyrndrobwllllantysiliogogogochensis TaxID=2590453 RepID=A0A540WW47_9BACT|nr:MULTISPECIES: hypothetical protein [Myxococcus]NTX00865.1 hypothetical protein [Myxococcus sp. CA040A]NTX12430.1 hypothetical protein [Myxococcus sp. CA056]NTX33449.1 hypothetical protein [Myxococcus sp. CA033]NTX55710.1 hypothetical protein [Myxococcus sp. CA039A]NTX59443.1 hypothetical protein [Myxococcus sp. CA051A]
MPRTSQEQTQERHAFLLTLFRQQPDISSKDALESFKTKFGATINLKTFNQLRAEAEEEVASTPVAEEPEVEVESAPETVVEDAAAQLKAAATPEALNGAAPAKKPKAKGTGSKNVFVDAPKEHLTFLESIVQQLQEAGAANVRIDHSTDRWMVLVVDPK